MSVLALPRRAAPIGLAVLWVLAAVGLAVAGVISISEFIRAGRPLLVDQGPLSFQPAIASELELFFAPGFIREAQVAVHVLGLTLFVGTAVVIFVRSGWNPLRTLTSVMLLLVGGSLFLPLSLPGVSEDGWAAVVGTLHPGPEFWRSAAGVALLLFGVLFPDGQFGSRTTRWFVVVFGVQLGLWSLLPGSVFDPREWGSLAAAWGVMPLVVLLAVQVRKFLRSPVEIRVRTRLVVIALGTATTTVGLLWVVQPRLGPGLFDLVVVTRRVAALYDLNLLVVLSVALMLLPVAVAVSVVRYGLWDIDVFVNRTLVYGALTGFIALAFVVGLVGLGSLLSQSVAAGRGLAGVITGAVVVSVIRPVRRAIQSAVDRRFYREKYDAQIEVERFSERVVDVVGLDGLREEIEQLLARTLHPVKVDLLVAGADFDVDSVEAASAMATRRRSALQDDPELGRDAAPQLWLASTEVVVPMAAPDGLRAVLRLSHRRDGRPYRADELRLLERISVSLGSAVRVAALVEAQEAEAVERARIESELSVARTIQQELLPRELPTLDGWQFESHYEPSRQVGGDYFDVLALPDGRFGLLVADVSGKGVPAALVMATCRSVFRSVATTVLAPADVMREVNASLYEDIPGATFVTCFYVVFDPATGAFDFANAGHPLPIRRTSKGGVDTVYATGSPFGWLPDVAYDEGSGQLHVGDLLMLYSDGVVEAMTPRGDMFGMDALVEFVGSVASTDSLGERLLERLRRHCAPSTDLGDDVTLLSIRRVS